MGDGHRRPLCGRIHGRSPQWASDWGSVPVRLQPLTRPERFVFVSVTPLGSVASFDERPAVDASAQCFRAQVAEEPGIRAGATTRRSRPAQTSARINPPLPGSLASKDDARVDAGGTARGLPRRDDGHRQNSKRRSSRDRRQGKSLEKVVGQQDTECRKTKWQP